MTPLVGGASCVQALKLRPAGTFQRSGKVLKMANTLLLILYIGGTLYFGAALLPLLPALIWFLRALISGAVKWPGPTVRDPDPRVNAGRLRLGLPAERLLFPAYLYHTLVLVAAFVFSLLGLLSATP